jgi:hypothetical protein
MLPGASFSPRSRDLSCEIIRSLLTSNGTSGEGIDIFGGGGNLVSGNVISGFDVGVFAAGGNNYSLENMVSNCAFGFDLSASDKYRFNTTFNCTTPFFGGTALTDNNN